MDANDLKRAFFVFNALCGKESEGGSSDFALVMCDLYESTVDFLLAVERSGDHAPSWATRAAQAIRDASPLDQPAPDNSDDTWRF